MEHPGWLPAEQFGSASLNKKVGVVLPDNRKEQNEEAGLKFKMNGNMGRG